MKIRILVASAAAAVLALTVGAWTAPTSPQRAAAASTLDGVPVHEAEVPALQSYVTSHPGQFAGLYADNASGTLHIDLAAGSATAAAAGLMREIAGQSRAPSRATGRMFTLAVRTVRYSQRQLEATMKQITTRQPWAAQVKPVLSTWGPDPVTDTVRVGVTHLSRRLVASAAATFGTQVTVVHEPRWHTQQLIGRPTKRMRIVHVSRLRLAKLEGRARSGQKSAILATPPRLYDTPPYYGGDRIVSIVVSQGVIVQWTECTVSFEWTRPAMSTAGHCGATGTVWYQGYVDQQANVIYISGNMGTAYATQWGNNRIDGQLMNGGSYYPSVYTSMTGPDSQEVTSVVPPWVGLTVCADGSFTGENCTAQVDLTNQCIYESDPYGNLTYVCGLDLAHSTNGSMLSQSGDSGGPVYSYNTPAAGVSACGLISGGANGGLNLAFTDIWKMIGVMNDGTVATV